MRSTEKFSAIPYIFVVYVVVVRFFENFPKKVVVSHYVTVVQEGDSFIPLPFFLSAITLILSRRRKGSRLALEGAPFSVLSGSNPCVESVAEVVDLSKGS